MFKTLSKSMTETTLRPWNMDDLPNLVKYANNPKIAKNLMDIFPHPYSSDDGKAFIKRNTESSPTTTMAIDYKGEAIGAIGLHQQNDIFKKSAEMGYWLAEPFWGKGIMTIMVKEMVQYGFEYLDINRIFARPFSSNIGSQMVLAKAGFNLEAKLFKTIYKNGEYLDELIYAIRKT